jgi:hypothetical protein
MDERRNIALDEHKKFLDCYPINSIFLPRKTADKIEKINAELAMAYNRFLFTVDMPSSNPDIAAGIEIFQKITTEIKDALEELGNEFRELLGDKELWSWAGGEETPAND